MREKAGNPGCYKCVLSDLKPWLECIRFAEEKPTRMTMDMWDDFQETTTKEALEKLFKQCPRR